MKYLFSLMAFLLSLTAAAQSNANKLVVDTLSKYQSATCLIIYDGAYTCTGTLLNNTSQNGKPLILSAAHCIDDPGQIESIVIVFGRQRVILGSNISGVEWRSDFGAELLAYSYELDFALLELKQEIPDEMMCQFMGWNISPNKVVTSSTVHHPSFDFKEVAHSRSSASIKTFNGLENSIPNGHWEVPNWAFGETVIGSSGAALLDQQLKVIGGLSGSTKKGNQLSDFFFRFDKAWNYSNENQLKVHLDPEKTQESFVNSISFRKLRNLDKISSYHFTDSIGESYFLESGNVLSQVITTASLGSIAGVYLTVEQIGADLLNTITLTLLSSNEVIHVEEISLFKLDENEENYIPFLSEIPFNGEIEIQVRLNQTVENEFVKFPSTKDGDLIISLLSKSTLYRPVLIEVEEDLLPFPNPSKGFIFVNQEIVDCWVYDLHGSYENIPFEYNAFGQTIIDLTRLASGIYYLTLITENNRESKEKIILR